MTKAEIQYFRVDMEDGRTGDKLSLVVEADNEMEAPAKAENKVWGLSPYWLRTVNVSRGQKPNGPEREFAG